MDVFTSGLRFHPWSPGPHGEPTAENLRAYVAAMPIRYRPDAWAGLVDREAGAVRLVVWFKALHSALPATEIVRRQLVGVVDPAYGPAPGVIAMPGAAGGGGRALA